METVKNTLEKSEKMAKSAEGAAQGLAQGFARDMRGYSQDAAATISDGYDTAIAWAKKNPLQAAAIGAGVGFVLGALIRRFAGRK